MEIEGQEKNKTTAKNTYLSRAKCNDLDFATKIKSVARPHIESFNFSCKDGLEKVTQYLNPLEIVSSEIRGGGQIGSNKESTFAIFRKIKIWYEDVKIG